MGLTPGSADRRPRRMTDEPLNALLEAANATSGADGWQALGDGQSITLYVASGGANLTVGKVNSVKTKGELVFARTLKGEHYVLQRKDIYAGATDSENTKKRTAGFV
jgi:hypothetical protein